MGTRDNADLARLFDGGTQKEQEGVNNVRGVQLLKQKEYVDWLTEAKTEETRSKRLAAAVDWISEGKTRNWKYVRDD